MYFTLTSPKKQTQSNPTCRGVAPCETGSPAPQFSLKNTQKNAPNFQETFNMHLFLFDNSIVLHINYTERHVYQSNMEKVYNAN